MYKYYNANSKGNFVNDCTIRAISLAEGKTWDKTYEELSDIAQRNGIILDDVNFIEPLLDHRYRRVCSNNMTVGDFVEKHQKGIYLITMKRAYNVLHKSGQYMILLTLENVKCGVLGKLCRMYFLHNL